MATIEVNLDSSEWCAIARIIRELAVSVTLNDRVIKAPFTEETLVKLGAGAMVSMEQFIVIEIADATKITTNPVDSTLEAAGFDILDSTDNLEVVEAEAATLIQDGVPESVFTAPKRPLITADEDLRQAVEDMLDEFISLDDAERINEITGHNV